MLLKMIDWLDFDVHILHEALPSWQILKVNEDFTAAEKLRVVSQPVIKTHEHALAGSFDTSILVYSTDTAESLKAVPRHADLITSGKLQNHATCLSVRGNPLKYLQGHNLFGTENVITLAYCLAEDVLPRLGFHDFFIAQFLRQIKAGEFHIVRLDITKMFDLGSNQAVDEYIRMLPRTVTARGGSDRIEMDRFKNSFYVGKHSTLWSLKIYNKEKEINCRSKKHQIPSALAYEYRNDLSRVSTGLKEYATGKLRVELRLQKKQLTRLELTDPLKLTAKTLNETYISFIEKITMRNQEIREIDIVKLSARLQSALSLWREGKDLKSIYPKSTYYYYRKSLLEYGIDIANPPIEREDKVALVRPLKVLVPKESSYADIPQHLHRFLIAEVA